MNNKHKGTNFDDFLKKENIDINNKDALIEQLKQYMQLCQQKTVDNFDLIKEKQQLKAENEKLKDKNNSIHSIAGDLQQRNHNLTLENEELKKQYNCYACGNCNGKEDYINLEKHHIGLRKQYDKYSQCLDEIFENIEYIEATAERIDDDNYIALACRIAETSRNILQKIKQAKESNNE